MKNPAKYWCGEPIKSLDELDEIWRLAEANRRTSSCFVMVGRIYCGENRVIPESWPVPKPRHMAWMLNQSYQRLKRQIAQGYIHKAEITPAYKEWLVEQCREAKMPVMTVSKQRLSA